MEERSIRPPILYSTLSECKDGRKAPQNGMGVVYTDGKMDPPPCSDLESTDLDLNLAERPRAIGARALVLAEGYIGESLQNVSWLTNTDTKTQGVRSLGTWLLSRPYHSTIKFRELATSNFRSFDVRCPRFSR